MESHWTQTMIVFTSIKNPDNKKKVNNLQPKYLTKCNAKDIEQKQLAKTYRQSKIELITFNGW